MKHTWRSRGGLNTNRRKRTWQYSDTVYKKIYKNKWDTNIRRLSLVLNLKDTSCQQIASLRHTHTHTQTRKQKDVYAAVTRRWQNAAFPICDNKVSVSLDEKKRTCRKLSTAGIITSPDIGANENQGTNLVKEKVRFNLVVAWWAQRLPAPWDAFINAESPRGTLSRTPGSI